MLRRPALQKSKQAEFHVVKFLRHPPGWSLSYVPLNEQAALAEAIARHCFPPDMQKRLFIFRAS
jgi:hypothetical protein